jgi:hypothetical protein
VAAVEVRGFDAGHLASTLLQTIYLFKFYHWETGYFNTLDITLDRAGYYICWGCLVWVPTFYTYSSYFFVYHVPGTGVLQAAFLFLLGAASIYYNYDVDRQKELFRTSNGKNVKVSSIPISSDSEPVGVLHSFYKNNNRCSLSFLKLLFFQRLL